MLGRGFLRKKLDEASARRREEKALWKAAYEPEYKKNLAEQINAKATAKAKEDAAFRAGGGNMALKRIGDFGKKIPIRMKEGGLRNVMNTLVGDFEMPRKTKNKGGSMGAADIDFMGNDTLPDSVFGTKRKRKR